MKTLNAPGDLNLSRVLRLIWQVKGISRIEIAQQLGIDKSTVTKIVASLEGIGIIREFAQGHAGPQGGRKPIQLQIVPEFGCALGIEINTDGFLAILVDLSGETIARAQEEMPVTSVFDAFDAAVARLAPEIESRNVPLIGVGVGVPAIVNTGKGSIIQSIPLMINDEIDFCARAREKYGVPVFIENDARAGCLSEITIRHGMNLDNALFLLAEIRKITGSTESRRNLSAGFGFILGGQPHYGAEFSSGEFRSILWEPGNSGQFQSNDITGERVGLDMSVTGSVFSELARHVALIVNLLNLNNVFIGGLSSELTETLAERIRREIKIMWPYALPQNCAVSAASLGLDSVAYGAAGHCLQRFFSLPSIGEPSRSGPSVKEVLSSMKGAD
jgi:predicted NBD/HSP70 family sugar kinase